MKISKGLKQAYDVQNFTHTALMAMQETLSQNGKISLTREDATAIGQLVRAWESAQERVRIHRMKPLPGSLKPEKPVKQVRKMGAIVPLQVSPA